MTTSTTNRKIDRAKLAEKFAELRARADLPEHVVTELDFWIKDDAKEIHAQPEAELHKAIESIKLILAGTKAPEHQPAAENAPRRDSESRGAIPDLDEANPVEQRAKSDRGHAVTNAEGERVLCCCLRLHDVRTWYPYISWKS